MAAIVVVGATFRLTDLDNRLVHCDEANQAVKFGILLEGGRYDYDPREHHGPSLSLFTLPIARLNAVDKLTELTETHLRLAPAVFGIVLIGFVWLLRDALGMAAALWAGLLTAVSPAMVFYSRYYIQEMLLVCFTFAAIVALGRCAKHFAPVENEQPTSPRRSRIQRACWAVLLGLSVGLMHSAKETCVIALFAMAVAAVIALPDLRRAGFRRLLLFGLIVATTAAASSALMFSGFLADAEDVRESYTTYATYFDRAGGEGSAGPHDYPWHHYFQRLFWWNRGQSHVWTEASIAALALVGLVAGAWGKGLMPAWVPMTRFLCIYTVLMTAIYCAIPYKTPWCALGFLHGMILLGGVGATVLIRAMPHWTARAAMGLLILAAAGHLGWQAHRAGFVEYREPDNPYFYAHTTADVPRLARRMQRIAAAHADGRGLRQAPAAAR